MMKLEEIELAISQLPSEQFAALREWIDEFEADLWDAEFKLVEDDHSTDFDPDHKKLNAIAEIDMAGFGGGSRRF